MYPEQATFWKTQHCLCVTGTGRWPAEKANVVFSDFTAPPKFSLYGPQPEPSNLARYNNGESYERR
jgi:hypothetical protein